MPIILPATGGGHYVVTFTDYLPSARTDGQAWTHVQVEEAAAQAGPWTVLANAALSPVDSDPANPQSRDFTLTGATLPAGWYRVTFIDAAGNLQPFAPILNGPTYTASREDVARKIKARTRDRTGNIGAFTTTTNPTAAEVDDMIVDATAAVASRIGVTIPESRLWMARRAVAIRAAMEVELAVTPEQTNGDETAYGRLLAQYNEAIAGLLVSLNDDQPNQPRYGSLPIVSPTLVAQTVLDTSPELLP